MKYVVEFVGPGLGDEACVVVNADSPDDAIPVARRHLRELAANPTTMCLLGRAIDPAEIAAWAVDVVHPT